MSDAPALAMPNPEQSSNAQPFPKASSSPTTSSTSLNSAWTGFSTGTSHSSPPYNTTPASTELNSSSNSNTSADKRVRAFGESWTTSSTFLPKPQTEIPDFSNIRRARSPSAPSLPTQAHPVPQRAQDWNLSRQLAHPDFDHITYPIEQYQARPYPGNKLKPSTTVRPAEEMFPRRLTTVKEIGSPSLVHHASVPNLSSQGRKVRFDWDEEKGQQTSREEKRLSSKSLSSLPNATRGKNGKPIPFPLQ